MAGDEGAFAALYDACGDRMFAVARSLSRSEADAEDIVQETFLALVRSRPALGAVRNLEAYAFTALRRTAGRLAARRPREAARSLDAALGPEGSRDSGSSSDAVDTAPRSTRPPSSVHDLTDERLEALDLARRALPVEQREVVALKIDGELTFAEIGEVLGIAADTAASRYRYALEKLSRDVSGARPDRTRARPSEESNTKRSHRR